MMKSVACAFVCIAVVQGRSIDDKVMGKFSGADALVEFPGDVHVSGLDSIDFVNKSEDRQDFTAVEGGLAFLPHEESDSLIDIYNRERLPRIGKIITSGDSESIDNALSEVQADPFSIKPLSLKFQELIFDDLYLGFQTQLGVFFVFLALIIPAMIPLLEIFIILVEEAIVWAIASV